MLQTGHALAFCVLVLLKFGSVTNTSIEATNSSVDQLERYTGQFAARQTVRAHNSQSIQPA